MKYDPKSANADLLSEDWYDATLKAKEGISKGDKTAGQPKIVVTSTVYANGLPYFIDDHFVSGVPFHMKRLKKLCTVIGIDFDAGEVKAEQIDGRGVRVQIETQISKDPKYDDKNAVAHYAPMDSGASTPPEEPATGEAPTGDDIPF